MEQAYNQPREAASLPGFEPGAIEFRGIASVVRGSVFELLAESYEGWSDREESLEGWRRADRDLFDHPDVIGACAVFTFLEGELVGFVSWDPREFPTAVIGHNCVRPACRGRGIGAAQLRFALGLLAGKQFLRATVRTGDSDFFAPARRMYASCGFREVGRASAAPGQTMGTVDHALDLVPAPRPRIDLR
jgi:GNAT superfamily N-acetyltransferase